MNTKISNTKINDTKINDTKISNTELIINTSDPLGNNIQLKESTFKFHITGELGDHPDRHFLNHHHNITKITKIINKPSMVLTDKTHEDRIVHIGLTALNGQDKSKCVKIISEKMKDNNYDIVTIIPTSKSNEIVDGRVLYDMYDNE